MRGKGKFILSYRFKNIAMELGITKEIKNGGK
jgi:hypothetical protein